jgi:hypothetical protein
MASRMTANASSATLSSGASIGAVEVDLSTSAFRHEGLDFDHPGAFDLERFQVRVLDEDVLALADLVALDSIGGINRLLGDRVDQVLFQSIARLAV